ncbi:MAG: GNAT family N-acetyltransferase [Halodesulfurarchaeum sp.]
MEPYESRVNGEIMQYVVLGMPADGPTLTLDWHAFSYAGKFEMSSTGKALLCDAHRIVAAAAFNEDRETSSKAWIRYLTVRSDEQGNGYGPRLATNVTETLLEDGYERVAIAVNNPRAYQALYKAGFHFTGRETGIAELVLEHPGQREPESYRAGLRRFVERDRPVQNKQQLISWLEDGTPPETVNGIPMAPSDEASDDGPC